MAISFLLSNYQIISAAVPILPGVEAQPLGSNISRVIEALEYLGAPLEAEVSKKLKAAIKAKAVRTMQQLLDEQVLFVVSLNPEVRVKVDRGPAPAVLQQGGFTPLLVKVLNDSTVARRLEITSPQAGPVYSGASQFSLKRQAQTELNKNENTKNETDRFLDIDMFHSRPMTANLSGLEVEYAIALIYSIEAGKREAKIGFHVGSGTQDIGFRNEVPVLFQIKKANPVRLSIKDDNGKPTAARIIFRDKQGHVYPPQAKRLAPDFFFQPQIYRHNGDVVLLPSGELQMEYCRGPEYHVITKKIKLDSAQKQTIDLQLKRWVAPMEYGFYCGDHHIHAAGCAHYQSPSQGVKPEDIFLQVKGEGLNVGCVLTWGYCWEFQRNFFSSNEDSHSEPLTLLKYDLEISGFGSAAMGHVCLLNLKDQTYPGTAGNIAGWPTWTVPVLRWCKQQGGVTGYPHSAMRINPADAASELLQAYDVNQNRLISQSEAEGKVLPAAFAKIDTDESLSLSPDELHVSIDQAADRLPNLIVPTMKGGGALEIFVSTAEGVCDFISAMDTERIGEWNTWYHLMNCGFPLKVSGETDFPCMSSRRVGQGRVYVQMGRQLDKLDFTEWCENLRLGRSYVSDGYAHALKFEVTGTAPGYDYVQLDQPETLQIEAEVAFAPELPKTVAYGQITPATGRRSVGDTRVLHGERSYETVKGGQRLVELVMNGNPVAQQFVPADGKVHALSFDVKVERSSWLALRHFPQMHTNPVNVIVNQMPIRASRESALWCAEAVKFLRKNRFKRISAKEQPAAEQAYKRALKLYLKRAAEAPAGT